MKIILPYSIKILKKEDYPLAVSNKKITTLLFSHEINYFQTG